MDDALLADLRMKKKEIKSEICTIELSGMKSNEEDEISFRSKLIFAPMTTFDRKCSNLTLNQMFDQTFTFLCSNFTLNQMFDQTLTILCSNFT
jgi:hypothetical protein